jgi:isocitrate dehydrogenase
MGLGDLYKKLENSDLKDEISKAILDVYPTQPNIAMVDSDNGITNLHASNDIIIDASMPVVVRDGGKMWNWEGKTKTCVAVIPDASYAVFHKAMVDDCVANGQYDVTKMGNVANVGLMAQKAEEYGSHPTTIELPEAGTVEVKDADGKVLMSHECEKGDIWRMSRAKDIPIKDWVRLAVERARLTGNPAVFWLDENRAHDRNMITKVNEYLKDLDTDGLEMPIMDVAAATKFTNARVREGKDTISVTGNVLRDHLTDMYPILELGTSAKMLSIVPLLAGGGLYETGAGGSAPKHVDQFLAEGHLRWDSLGEFLALAESLRFIAQKNDSKELSIVTAGLDFAANAYLDNNKVPSRKAGEPDNKASHYYLATYWAEYLSTQTDDSAIAEKFKSVYKELKDNEDTIIKELLSIEGKAQDIGGYYHPNDELAEKAMRPSETLNNIINNI